MRAGVTVERFWSLDAPDVLVEIRGYQERQEDLDALLAHHTAHLLAPHRRKNAGKLDPAKLRRFAPREEPDTDEEDTEESRAAFFREHAAGVGSPVP